MSKRFYVFTAFFLALSLIAGCVHSVIYFCVGPQMFNLESYFPWLFTVNVISIITSLFILKYYYHKRFWLIFITATIVTVLGLCSFIIFSFIFLTGKFAGYYVPIYCSTFITSILYGISLIFTAREKTWLKITGLFIFIINLFLLSVMLRTLFFPNSQANEVLEKINQWTLLARNLIPILFIIHFREELSIIEEENLHITMRKSLENQLSIAGKIVLLFMVIFGLKIAFQSYSSLYWGKKSFENAKVMAGLFDARTFVNNKGDTLFYHLLKPLNYDAKKKYPLVVCLPYGGQPGTDKTRQIEGAQAAELLSTDINRRAYPAFLFVPNCPPGSGWGGIPDYPTVDSLVYEAISALDEEPGIDVKRRYITGISRGGYGSWHFICTRPDMFAAAIPVCGGGDPRLASRIVGVAVWAFHGDKDKNVPVNGSRDMITAIKNAGGNPKYTEYPNMGHNIWNDVSITTGLLDWLFAQKRD